MYGTERAACSANEAFLIFFFNPHPCHSGLPRPFDEQFDEPRETYDMTTVLVVGIGIGCGVFFRLVEVSYLRR